LPIETTTVLVMRQLPTLGCGKPQVVGFALSNKINSWKRRDFCTSVVFCHFLL